MMSSSKPGAAAAGPDTPSSTEPCLECLRRKFQCDGTRPVCSRCRTAGIVCPGYGNAKPLVWLAPGKVTSHTRKTKRMPAKPSKSESSSSSSSSANIPVRVKVEQPRERPMQSLTFLHADQTNMKQQISHSRRKTTTRKGKEKDNTEIREYAEAGAIIKSEMSPSIPPLLLSGTPTELSREWLDMTKSAEYCTKHHNQSNLISFTILINMCSLASLQIIDMYTPKFVQISLPQHRISGHWSWLGGASPLHTTAYWLSSHSTH